ncbi:MAG: nicotinate phosphoribosyltransferase [Actinobacteria bacterium]|nr:MAG: nicotinate phosphoribosyltransferase [Actinomycetota bacterium]
MNARSENPGMLADLYEFTMAASYFEHRVFAPATFSLFIRNYPENRNYFVSAGLEQVLEFLQELHFEQADLDFLASRVPFSDDFLQYLSELCFTGDVFAIPEGRLFFEDEPVLEVTGPMIEAQIAETFVINQINFQTSVATKAARCFHAAGGRNLVDFSLRRTQGFDAGNAVARASFIGGFDGTSDVLGGKLFDIPIFGTMAHSFVTAFDSETDSFRAFAETFPKTSTLLIDTYDTVAGARKAARVAKEMEARGDRLRAVRLDSGDIAALSKEVRRVLDEAGLEYVGIFASGGFDEYEVAEVLSAGGQINGFGVGTKMGVSADAPYTDMAYKLVEYDGRPILKLSTGKATLAGQKQVFRHVEQDRIARDEIALRGESCDGEPLLAPVMEKGKRLLPTEPLTQIRDRFKSEFSKLDDEYKDLAARPRLPVGLSRGLQELQAKAEQHVRETELGES